MGDVVHNLPVVDDILRAHPDAEIDWVVEEPYAGLVRLHPRVARVIPIALRRWRREILRGAVRAEFRAFLHALRAQRYDYIIDTQSLVKSALVARLARGERVGYSARACRESMAALFYDRRMDHAPVKSFHAVGRYRELAGWALGYAPAGEPSYGLQPVPVRPDWLPRSGGSAAPPYAVFLSATARAAKKWPEADWIALAQGLIARGFACVFAWGSAAERACAEALVGEANRGAVRASTGCGGRVCASTSDLVNGGALLAPEAFGLVAWAEILAGAALVVGVDTGLTYLAAAVGTPTVGVYCDSSPLQAGIEVDTPHRNLGEIGAPPAAATVIDAALALARA